MKALKACGNHGDENCIHYIMEEKTKWKRIQLPDQIEENIAYERHVHEKDRDKKRSRKDRKSHPVSEYLIACRKNTEDEQKELLYRVLGPVFFGKEAAKTDAELILLFQERYGIDVRNDFYEGDDHYEEYLEAQHAIAEGYSIYGGAIMFDDEGVADLAEQIWGSMEQEKRNEFRRINTMLEE